MAGRPRKNRDTIKGAHLSIRLTEKEVSALNALVGKANTEKEKHHAQALAQWEQRSAASKLIRKKPEPPKPATYADVVRLLLEEEVRTPRLYEKGFWSGLKDTEPLDYLVELANDREHPAYRWTRETILRKLIQEEWGRRRLTQAERVRFFGGGSVVKFGRTGLMRKWREEEWVAKANDATPSGLMPDVRCPHCKQTFELPPR